MCVYRRFRAHNERLKDLILGEIKNLKSKRFLMDVVKVLGLGSTKPLGSMTDSHKAACQTK